MKNFALIGVAGYIAPRHLRAISSSGHDLVAALDRSDSVGIIDTYFPDADFFTEFERFDRHIDKLASKGKSIDYLSICTPNYLHDAHIRFGLKHGSDVICEKPLVLEPRNIEGLIELESTSGRKVNTILQLRLHPTITALREEVVKVPDKIHDIDLTYITPRGHWYYTSWKSDPAKSGGIATNIGIHFFDMLSWIYGEVRQNIVHVHTHDRAAGYLEFERARVRWFLSIDADMIPGAPRTGAAATYRSMVIDGREIEFSDGFADLHTDCYRQILNGCGTGLADAMPSIRIAHHIRHQQPVGVRGDYHPLAAAPLPRHPFYIGV